MFVVKLFGLSYRVYYNSILNHFRCVQQLWHLLHKAFTCCQVIPALPSDQGQLDPHGMGGPAWRHTRFTCSAQTQVSMCVLIGWSWFLWNTAGNLFKITNVGVYVDAIKFSSMLTHAKLFFSFWSSYCIRTAHQGHKNNLGLIDSEYHNIRIDHTSHSVVFVFNAMYFKEFVKLYAWHQMISLVC